jgi:hypothetical protein
MCFVNAVLQLLVHSPPFWNMFRELGDLKGQHGAGLATGGGATPLADGTMRFLEEFVFKEPPPTQQATGGKPREGEETNEEYDADDTFEPTYMGEAMKEKKQLKTMLVRFRAAWRLAVTDLCWPNMYRMANGRMRKSFFRLYLKRFSRYLLLLVALLLHPE